MASENIVQITDGNFETEVMGSSQPVLVDFWAEWCMPCRALGPVLDSLASEFAGKAKIGKMDVDSNRNVPMQFNINAIPTIIVFKDGKVVKKLIGLKKKDELLAALAEAGAK